MRQETRNYRRFYALLNKMPHGGDLEELKRDIVRQYTGNRTESLREMTGREYNAMCVGLEDATGEAAWRQQQRDELRRRRSVCLRLMQQLGIDTTDWARVNDFCNDPRIASKVFAGITLEGLDKLAVKLRAIQRAGGLRKRERPEERRPRGLVVYMYGGGMGEC